MTITHKSKTKRDCSQPSKTIIVCDRLPPNCELPCNLGNQLVEQAAPSATCCRSVPPVIALIVVIMWQLPILVARRLLS